jgi:hypothetical protein
MCALDKLNTQLVMLRPPLGLEQCNERDTVLVDLGPCGAHAKPLSDVRHIRAFQP